MVDLRLSSKVKRFRTMPQIILASQSPRRIELLTKMGVPFTAIPSNYDEQLDESRSAEAVAMEPA